MTIQFGLASNGSVNQSSVYRILIYRQPRLFSADSKSNQNPVIYLKPGRSLHVVVRLGNESFLVVSLVEQCVDGEIDLLWSIESSFDRHLELREIGVAIESIALQCPSTGTAVELG